MNTSADGVWSNLHIMAGMLPQHPQEIRDAALLVRDGKLVWAGAHQQLPPGCQDLPQHDGGGAQVSAGLVDCHTHLIYGGNRADEFAQRLAGVSYADIARAGGGIMSTVNATRAASEDTLYRLAAPRLQGLLDEGVCALEIKSGYGLEADSERRMLRVARQLAQDFGITIRTTFLGAHALPPEFANRADDYVDLLCSRMLPALQDEGLVDAVDVFCEHLAFSPAQTERIFRAASARGLPVKIHAEQLSDQGGAALAARYHALSADHLEHLSAEGIAAMQAAGTVAVLLPGAYYMLRDTHLPPIEALRAAGVPMAVASDHNPGTCPALSLVAMLNMACTLFRLTVDEALAGVTRHAAQALGLQHSHGQLHLGQPAGFVLWPITSPAELAYWFGRSPKPRIVRQGNIIMEPAHD
jgi:imidazolonepropionase